MRNQLRTTELAHRADDFVCHFYEAHQLSIQAEGSQVLAVVAALTGREDFLIRTMITLREFPGRVMRRLGVGAGREGPPFGLADFVPLGGDERTWCAFGLIGRFWQRDYGLVPVASSEAFYQYMETGVPKLIMGFHVHADAQGRVVLTTETGIHCPDPDSLRRMSTYWFLIRPASGWIRRRLLRQIKMRAEARNAS